MADEPLSRDRLAAIRAGIERNPGAPAASTIRLLLREINRLTPVLTRACPLTPQRLEVLIGAANGETCRMTGRRMGLSEWTVRSHRNYVYGQLGVDGAAQAVAVAMTNAWIAPDQIRIPEPAAVPAPRKLKPATGTRRSRHRVYAAELRQQPREWVPVGTYKTHGAARQTAHRIRTGQYTAYRPAGTYEAKPAARDGAFAVQARYVGTPTHTAEKAAS
jgi:DNA-binding CsgD family transcriptional regulator